MDYTDDKRHELDTVNNPQDMVSTYIKLRSHLRYNGAGVGDIQKHGIYAFFISSDAGFIKPYNLSNAI